MKANDLLITKNKTCLPTCRRQKNRRKNKARNSAGSSSYGSIELVWKHYGNKQSKNYVSFLADSVSNGSFLPGLLRKTGDKPSILYKEAPVFSLLKFRW